MIEINLLPQELRKKPSPFAGLSKIDLSGLDIKSIPMLQIGIGAGIVMAIVPIILLAIILFSNSQVSDLSKKYANLLPMKKEADALKAHVADINKRSAAIDELIVKRFSWAKKLNMLSDSITPGIWLSELDYDERPVVDKGKKVMPGALAISGYASGAGEQGAVLIGKFIKSMEENKDFFKDFEGIDLVSTRSDKVDNQEVMSFRIVCYFK